MGSAWTVPWVWRGDSVWIRRGFGVGSPGVSAWFWRGKSRGFGVVLAWEVPEVFLQVRVNRLEETSGVSEKKVPGQIWIDLPPCLVVNFSLMAKISKETVSHVAKLARLGLTDKEAEKFSGQLSDVFEYMEVLEEVDTEGVEETSQVTGLENVSEKDEVVKWTTGSGDSAGKNEVTREDLLGTSELPVESNQILVKAAIKK